MRQLFFYSTLLFLVAVASCKKDDDISECPCDDPSNPECPNYDPCLLENRITANFKIYDDVFSGGPNSDQWFEDDVLYGGRIKFEAVEQDANYKWYLGQETLEGTEYHEVVKTLFDLNPGTYSAALRVQKEPNLQCFPNDTGIDSTFRTFEVVGICDLMIMNKFKGVFESAPNDSIILEFFPYKLLPGNQDWEVACEDISGIGYINFSGQHDTILDGSASGILNRYFERYTIDQFIPKGYFEVFIDSTCIADYEMYGQQMVFTGKIIE